jgi:hypothetical protein
MKARGLRSTMGTRRKPVDKQERLASTERRERDRTRAPIVRERSFMDTPVARFVQALHSKARGVTLPVAVPP